MTAYRHKPMSEILAPAAEPVAQALTPAQLQAEAAVAEQALPEKYQGKTVTQVAEMHLNAEAELGRVRNENNTYRGLVQDLSTLQRTTADSQPEVQEQIVVSGDDLIQNPVETVRRIVKQDLDANQRKTDEAALTQQVKTEGLALINDFGNIDAVVATEDFRRFAIRTPGRQADFNVAASGSGLEQVRAARRLLEDFQDFQEITKPVEGTKTVPLTPVEIAKQVQTEGTGPAGSVSTRPQIFEADVIKMVTEDPVRYRSPTFQTELTAAIKEGRFVTL